MHIDRKMGAEEIMREIKGTPKYSDISLSTVERVIQLVQLNEFKRAQLVQTVKIHNHSFGIGRHVPIATGFRP